MARKAQVLIVDDDIAVLQMLRVILEKGGYEVIRAESGVEALSKAEAMKPNLVVLDVMMPGIDGLVVCRRLRANPATRHLPIIMLSALEKVDDKLKGFQAGADDYVAKPVDGKELLARVKALLGRVERRRAPAAQTVALVGAKGGVGVTSVAVNLGVTLTRQQQTVAVFELQSWSGSVAHLLKLNNELNWGSLLALEVDALTSREISRKIVLHSSGLRLLLAPPAPIDHRLTAAHVDKLVDVLAQGNNHLLLDLPHLDDGAMRRAVELSDHVLLVTSPDHLSIACAQARLEQLKAWDAYERTNLVIVQRSASAIFLNQIEVESRLGMGGTEFYGSARWDQRPLDGESGRHRGAVGMIPPAAELFFEATREGVPIVLIEPSAPPARAIVDLAHWLAEQTQLNSFGQQMPRYIE